VGIWIAREGRSHLAPQILNPGMRLGWHAGALVAGRRLGRRHIFAGPPCGTPPRMREALDSLEPAGRDPSKRILWFGVTEKECDTLGVPAKRRVHLGDQAILCARVWAEREGLPATLRAQIRRAERHAMDWRRIPLTPKEWALACRQDPSLLLSIQECRRQWLGHKKLPPMGFLTACLDPSHRSWLGYPLRHLLVATLHGKVMGYAIASAIPLSRAMLVENCVRHPKAPNGFMELMMHQLSQWGLSLGCEDVNVGLAPLFQDPKTPNPADRFSPNWFLRTRQLLWRFGEPFYSFQGLARFKQRLHPKRWEPLFLIVPKDGFRPWDAFAIARAFFDPIKEIGLVDYSVGSPSASG
jgi:lysylphosphatidylglycerol synthetase-like protein (DUF2156 family)